MNMTELADALLPRTVPIFYREPLNCGWTTRIVRIGNDFIELAETVAYPRGHGQDSDQGLIRASGLALRFIDARTIFERPAGLPAFPGLETGGRIWHRIHRDDRRLLRLLKLEAVATITIDARRRARLVLSHTAAHLLALGVEAVRPDARATATATAASTSTSTAESLLSNIEWAQVDVQLTPLMSPSDIERITAHANRLIQADAKLTPSLHREVAEARSITVDGKCLRCAALHLARAGPIGPMDLTHVNLGRDRERLRCTFPQSRIDLGAYYFKPGSRLADTGAGPNPRRSSQGASLI